MHQKNFNRACVAGILDDLDFSHTSHYEDFCFGRLSVKRKSGIADFIPVIVSEDIMTESIVKGAFVKVTGTLRSHHQTSVDGQKHLYVYVFANSISISDTEEYINDFCFSSNVKTMDPIRTTPLGRTITDFMVLAPKSCNKVSLIPCIAWGKIADLMQGIPCGSRLEISGRLQSREYVKNDEIREVMELSVIRFFGLNEN